MSFRLYVCTAFILCSSTYVFYPTQSMAQVGVDNAIAQAGTTLGQCYVLRGKEKIRIGKGFKFFTGDQIVTSKNSVIEIIYADGSNNLLQGDSSVSIEEFKTQMNGERVSVKSVLNMVRGKARFFFRPRPGGVDATVKTKSSIMGVRGTTFIVDEDENTKETKLAVLTGQVAVQNAEMKNETPVLVKPNQSTTIKPQQKPAEPKNLSKEEVIQIAESMPKLPQKTQDGYVPETLELPPPEPADASEKTASGEKSEKRDDVVTVLINRNGNRDPLCAQYRFNNLKKLAQTFDPDAAILGQQLAKCNTNADEALYWLAFYHYAQAELNLAIGVGRYLPPRPKSQLLDSMAEYDAVIYAANDAKPKFLKEKVDTDSSSYAVDGGAILTLARSMVRTGQFEQARKYYEKYLGVKKIKIDEGDIRVEEIYSYLWARDYDTAKKLFSQILRENIGATARASAENGFIIASQNGYKPGKKQESINLSMRSLSQTSAGYADAASILEARVFDGFYAKARLFTLKTSQTDAKEKTKNQSADLFVSKEFQNIWGLGLTLGAGYSGIKNGYPIYLANLNGNYNSLDIAWDIGVQGAPSVYFERPLRTDAIDTTENIVTANFSYSWYAKYGFSLSTLSINSTIMSHNFEVRLPLMPRVPIEDKLNIKLYAHNETHSKSVARYYSPKSLTFAGAGLEFEGSPWDWLRILVDGDVGVFSQKLFSGIEPDEPAPNDNPFLKQYSAEKGTRIRANTKLTYVGWAQWNLWLAGKYEKVNSSEGNSLLEKNEGTLGAEYLF